MLQERLLQNIGEYTNHGEGDYLVKLILPISAIYDKKTDGKEQIAISCFPCMQTFSYWYHVFVATVVRQLQLRKPDIMFRK